MHVCLSRHRITYTPTGGEPQELLSPMDYCEAEPAFEGGPETQVEATLLSLWASHSSRGNARVNLRFDKYVPAPCEAQAQARMHKLWRWINEHPEGEIEYETAFLGMVSAPLIRWKMRATLNRVQTAELNPDTCPFAEGAGYQQSLDFAVSRPTDIT